MSGWEEADVVPPASRRYGPNPITLQPGEIRKRKASNDNSTRSAVRYSRGQFSKRGLPEFHVASRKIDGEYWVYIWRDIGRDPIEEGVS